MRKLLGPLAAFAVASIFPALGAGQALAATVHCGDTITQDTTLDNDLVDCAGDGLVVPPFNPDITIDLNGHTIDGVRASGELSARTAGINANHTDLTVENGVIQEFGYAVITAKALMDADNMVFRRNYTAFEANHSGGTITNSVMTENHIGVMSQFQSNNIYVSDSVIVHSEAEGVRLGGGELTNDLIAHNGGSGVVSDFPFGDVSNSRITDNGQHGVRLDYGGSVVDSILKGNALDGIHADHIVDWPPDSGGAALLRNATDRNGDDGIDVRYFPSGATVSENHAWRNGDLGIEAVPGTLGGGNWAKHNGNPLQCVPGTLCSTTGKPKQ
jgi:large repetitive protein